MIQKKYLELSTSQQIALALTVVVLITALVEYIVLDLSPLAALVLFLFLVFSAAYYFSRPVSLGVATLAYFLFNYLVVEPRYSLHVPDPRSWIVLAGFILVSLRVNILVNSLKVKSSEAQLAAVRHEFARTVSESLLRQDSIDQAVQAVKHVLESLLDVQVSRLEAAPPGLVDPCLDAQQPKVLSHELPDGRPCWLMPVVQHGTSQRGAGRLYLQIQKENPGDDPLLNESLQLACDQLNACVRRIDMVQQVQHALLQRREEEVRNRLLASFSHDMRTPLTAILGAATSLNSQYHQLTEKEIQALLLSIEAEAFHMATTCENILSLVKLKSVVELPQPLPWQSPVELIEATVRRYELRRHGRSFRVDCPDDPPLLQADAVLLTQALTNLIDNACCVHEGPEPLLIRVSSQDHAGKVQLCISVLDRGPGFPAELNCVDIQLGNPLTGTSVKGFGLGLSITKVILDLHKAELRIAPRPGGGSEVSMVFMTTPPLIDNHAL